MGEEGLVDGASGSSSWSSVCCSAALAARRGASSSAALAAAAADSRGPFRVLAAAAPQTSQTCRPREALRGQGPRLTP